MPGNDNDNATAPHGRRAFRNTTADPFLEPGKSNPPASSSQLNAPPRLRIGSLTTATTDLNTPSHRTQRHDR
jgi:hypothetical protein